jgi:hypothetical protein
MRTLEQRLEQLESAARRLESTAQTVPAFPFPAAAAPAEPPKPAEDTSPAPPPAPESTPVPEAPPATPAAEPTAAPPKRQRRTRREETHAPAPAAPAEAPVPVEETPAPTATPEPAQDSAPEPVPLPSAQIPEVAPVAPDTADPFQNKSAPPPAEEPPAAVAPPPAAEPPSAEPPAEPPPAPAPKKRSPRKTDAPPEPSLDLVLDEVPPAAAPGTIERTLASDGATRLLATAYIGIGNRLFIRGDGPGLSWEKGVPLQFVSIGKWRWETNEATGPIRFKLYKNDAQECTSLGEQILEPGHLQEMTAAF